MKIILNGEETNFDKIITITELIEHYKLNPKTVVIELNEEILPRDMYGVTQVSDNDRIEMVVFVGGG